MFLVSGLWSLVGPEMHKLSWLSGDEWVEHSHEATFVEESGQAKQSTDTSATLADTQSMNEPEL